MADVRLKCGKAHIPGRPPGTPKPTEVRRRKPRTPDPADRDVRPTAKNLRRQDPEIRAARARERERMSWVRRAAFIGPASPPCEGRRNKPLRTRRGSLHSKRPQLTSGGRCSHIGHRRSACGQVRVRRWRARSPEGAGGGEVGVGKGVLRIGSASLLEPEDRLVHVRLQQMHLPNPVIV